MPPAYKRTVPPDLWARCQRYGIDLAEYYGSGAASAQASLAVEHPTRKVHDSPEILAASKGAEVAFCLATGVDVETLRWDVSLGAERDGIDCWFGCLSIDVKLRLSPRKSALVWPLTKAHLIPTAKVDILVNTRLAPAAPVYELLGWGAMWRFKGCHEIAGENDPEGLDPGTPYIHGVDLIDMRKLRPAAFARPRK